MSELLFRRFQTNGILLVASFFTLSFAPSTHANVYATNVKLNGGTTNLTLSPTTSITVSYVLNEAATNVTLKVLAGQTPLSTLQLTDGSTGTLRGQNTIEWTNAFAGLSNGVYSIAVTAYARGYSTWSNIISDEDVNTYVYDGRGIAVDRNAASTLYGRVYVANSSVGISPATTPGDNVGILRFNADSSTPEEGILSPANPPWSGNELGPRKLEFAGSNQIYAINQGQNGNTSDIFSWQADLSTNSQSRVLSSGNNLPTGSRLNGFALFTQRTNNVLLASDNSASSLGILGWMLGTNGACLPGDLGSAVVGFGDSGTGLSLPPQDVSVDPAGNIYVCQSVLQANQTTPVILKFPAYDPSTNGGAPETVATWAVGDGTNVFGGATGIAVDPTGKYVAASFEGIIDQFGFPANGNTKVLSTTNGSIIAEVDLNLTIQGDSSHQDTDCAWDAVGNLYYIDNYWGRWRAVSPPGANSATTLALSQVQIIGATVTTPNITSITVTGGNVTLLFTADAQDSASSFQVLSSPSIVGTYVPVTSATITQTAPGRFQAVFPLSGPLQFYRVIRGSISTPNIISISVAGGNVTLLFSGQTQDSPSAFKVLSSPSVVGNFAQAANATITQTATPGRFQAVVPVSGPIQFYRILR